MKYLLSIILAFMSQTSLTYAAGYSNYAIPTEVEMVNGGFLIRGAFGNPGGCDNIDMIYIKDENSHFDGLLAMAMTALSAQMKLKMYVNTCESSVPLHFTNSVNISVNRYPFYLKR